MRGKPSESAVDLPVEQTLAFHDGLLPPRALSVAPGSVPDQVLEDDQTLEAVEIVGGHPLPWKCGPHEPGENIGGLLLRLVLRRKDFRAGIEVASLHDVVMRDVPRIEF